MRKPLAVGLFALLFAACDSESSTPRDFGGVISMDQAAPDLSESFDMHSEDLTTADLPPPCPQPLLEGSSTPDLQGWSVLQTSDAVGTVSSDQVLIQYNTASMPCPAPCKTGPMVLYYKEIGISDGTAYALEWRLKVVTSDTHNPLDAAVAFMGSFTPSTTFGTAPERSQMIYFETGAIGWADDSTAPQAVSRYLVNTTDVFHVYRLDVDAAGHAEVRVDGNLALTREGFSTNGTIAIGDQTNEANLESQFLVYSIRKLCP
jgi:hypothetical protein